MNENIFFETEFILLVIFSMAIPAVTFGVILLKKAVSRHSVLLFGIVLMLLAGIDAALLQKLASMAKLTPSIIDDAVFASELSIALYLLPAALAGIGANVVSHVLIDRLSKIAKQFDQDHPQR